MSRTDIEWTKYSWNPVVGCSKCSPGCQNCYAERMAWRLACMPIHGYQGVVNEDRKWSGNIVLMDQETFDKPLHWRKPGMVFCGSMTDLFHPSVPFEWIDEIMAIIWELSFRNQGHIFQFLTKRIEREKEYFHGRSRKNITEIIYKKFGRHSAIGRMATPENLWLGVTVCTQDETWKADMLRTIPSAVHFVSIEPCLEDIKYDFDLLDWVIVGCETGPRRRPCKIEWAESIAEQCTNTPLFVKALNIGGKVVKDINQFPKHLQRREFPKGAIQ